MKVFHCGRCRNVIFFENVRCLGCDSVLAYLPDLGTIAALESAGDDRWRCLAASGTWLYRLCENYRREEVCNWAIPASDPHDLCQSCRLTHVIPDLSRPGNKEAWFKLEAAKRRLIYGLLALQLPL